MELMQQSQPESLESQSENRRPMSDFVTPSTHDVEERPDFPRRLVAPDLEAIGRLRVAAATSG